MRIALIKMSSMGDVIHALPVVSDILRVHPDATIDWVVEPPFAPLARLHGGVNELLPVALRRWRREMRLPETRAAFKRARAEMAKRHYDLILDLQGLLKSAWVGCWMHGLRAGYSSACARESLAAWVYQRRYTVDMNAHAIEKMRSLSAQALGYQAEGLPVFNLTAPPRNELAEVFPSLPNQYWVFLHATSRAEKRWPVAESVAFLRAAAKRGQSVLLPWGSPAEQAAAHDLVAQAQHGAVLPAMDLHQCASLLGHADGVVGVDTGLTHLSAALEVPTIALFAATEAWRYGPYWTEKAASMGEAGQWPEAAAVESRLLETIALASGQQ